MTAGIGATARRTEAEIAFLADPETFRALAEHPLLGGPARRRRERQRSLFFDTEAADLSRSGLTLQLRHARGRNVLSLETRDAPAPIEVSAPGEAPQIELLPPQARGLIADATARAPIRPCFVSEIWRARRMVVFEGASLEVAFDEGEIVADERREPLREIVLTLKAGAPASLYRFGLALTRAAPLSLSAASRFERGLALAKGEAPASVKAAEPDFDAATTLDAAIGALLTQNLQHFLANAPALNSPDAAEAVHQLRVALRRLRSLLSFLRRAFASPELEALRAEAKRIADAFGQARDWRVFSDMVREGPASHMPDVAGLPALVAHAEANEQAGRAAGAAVLADVATARFVLALQAYVAAHGWRGAADGAHLRALGEPAAPFAAQALEHAFRRLRKRARGFDTLGAEARHEMRIALKQMRYGVDFFGPLFEAPAAVASFAKAASLLQDLLGAANDAAVAAQLVAKLDFEGDCDFAFAGGAVVGWRQHAGLVDERALRKGWKALRRAKRFWRDALPPEEESAA
jgi:inorganic triphosphatase YgiF